CWAWGYHAAAFGALPDLATSSTDTRMMAGATLGRFWAGARAHHPAAQDTGLRAQAPDHLRTSSRRAEPRIPLLKNQGGDHGIAQHVVGQLARILVAGIQRKGDHDDQVVDAGCYRAGPEAERVLKAALARIVIWRLWLNDHPRRRIHSGGAEPTASSTD